MKKGFYPRLAYSGIVKNKRLYIPYLLACIAMVMMQYILMFLQHSDALAQLSGVRTLRSIFWLGGYVVALFSAGFLFYTNSFLMRRRKREFGLYNVLGMDKRNIGRILAWETLFVLVIALGAGLVAGIALSKLAELILIRLVRGDVRYSLAVSSASVLKTVMVFGVIFILLFLNTLRQVWLSGAIALMRSENVGEKPPKANWLLGILGLAVLAAGYYMALTVEDAYSALFWFFIAVLLVIVATYLLMTAGSVLLCRILQKNKRYYYRTKHFVSVSSMAYRMKRNGAGLASICILATMVLVTVSSTACLYFGAEEAIGTRYPREINLQATMASVQGLREENLAKVRATVSQSIAACGAQEGNVMDYRMLTLQGFYHDDGFETDGQAANAQGFMGQALLHLVPLEAYNRMAGQNVELNKDEVLLYTLRTQQQQDRLTIDGKRTLRVKQHLETFEVNGNAAMNILPEAFLVVRDIETMEEIAALAAPESLYSEWVYGFDTGLDTKEQITLCSEIGNGLNEIKKEQIFSKDAESEDALRGVIVESRAKERADFYSLYGGLFFLGTLLSLVFLLAAVLIIYYKQITEGYEDEARFRIMQKVGMTDQEIRSSINSQLKTVFFLPLIFAGLHLAFSFPMVRKLLMLFNLRNVRAFALTNAVCFVSFVLLYLFVYRRTAGAYYRIVRGAKAD